MLLGFYYSVWDLKHPDYSEVPGSLHYARYQQYMLDQATELLTKYGSIVALWMDGAHLSPLHRGEGEEFRATSFAMLFGGFKILTLGRRRS